MLHTSDKKSIDRIQAEYCSGVNRRIFGHLLAHVTQNHGMLVIDNQSTRPQIDTICFHANILPYPPQLDRLGPTALWDYDTDYYCEEDILRPDPGTANAWQREQEQQHHCVVTDHKGTLLIRKT